jgi:hypothetical protein
MTSIQTRDHHLSCASGAALFCNVLVFVMPSFRMQSVWGKNPLAETTRNHWTRILESAQKFPRKRGSRHSNPNQAFEDYATLALGLHTLMTIRHAQGGNTFFGRHSDGTNLAYGTRVWARSKIPIQRALIVDEVDRTRTHLITTGMKG